MPWKKPLWPGDGVRIARLRRGGEVGDVRIQDYENFARVAAFLPGQTVVLPGDTPKFEPDIAHYYPLPDRRHDADITFDKLLEQALQDGWEMVNG